MRCTLSGETPILVRTRCHVTISQVAIGTLVLSWSVPVVRVNQRRQSPHHQCSTPERVTTTPQRVVTEAHASEVLGGVGLSAEPPSEFGQFSRVVAPHERRAIFNLPGPHRPSLDNM